LKVVGLRTQLCSQAALLREDATIDEVRGALRREIADHQAESKKLRATKRKLGDVYRKLDGATALLLSDNQYDDTGLPRRRGGSSCPVSLVMGSRISMAATSEK